MIYIDPPFDSKADYRREVLMRGKSALASRLTFEEKQYTDIWANDEYLQFMYERITLLRELLSDNGSIFLHCDYHRSHYLRCILDEIFGKDNFVNEILWKRANTVKANGGQGGVNFGENTDTIFLYRKGPACTFNVQHKPYTQDYIDAFYKYFEDDTNRQYRLISMTAPGGDGKGNPYYDVMGVSRHWRYSKERMADLIARGQVVQTKPGNVPQRKLYLDQGQGVPLQTLWDDIPGLAAVDGERTGYPTQKPEILLERVIKTGSNPGDLVLDCFMGSGTTQAVAMKLGRRFIGADINLGAIHTASQRLITVARECERKVPGDHACYGGFEVYNVNHYDLFRNPAQAKDLLIDALEIQKLEFSSIYDGEKDGRMVKIMPVNRIATRADLGGLVNGFDYKAFERRHAEKPNQPVEKLLLVCMGHEPDLAACLQKEVPFKLDISIVDILRDKSNLEFKRDAEARLAIVDGDLVIERFYPMNLLQKLSMSKETVEDWRELVETVMIDWNYDGAVLQPIELDSPGRTEMVRGRYTIPADAGTIRVKITDLLSESWEGEIHG
ncbi:site-specific DNA-methyltransferase [Caballeronia sordidicola]|uniref:site-specific DNA-methyltransferase n=1 Tax=Caballeronia sordidicola TaxID=196367 RepID=UPI00211B21D2|nr:site-specific DNA-methyltransferase [Caballeronia sordidicola]